jgi:hypothetical protein
LIGNLVHELLDIHDLIGAERQAVSRQEVGREVFCRVICKPDFALIVLPNGYFLRGIDRVRPGLPHERRTILWSTEKDGRVRSKFYPLLCRGLGVIDTTEDDLAICFDRVLKSLDCLLH